MMEIQFNEEELKQVDVYFAKYPEKKAALMPILWMAQKKFGYMSKDVVEYVSNLVGVPTAHTYGVISFYTMYFRKPMGKYHIQVCTNVSCMLRKGDEIYKQVSEMLQVGHNETTPDGLFSLEEVECMGACGGAPMIAINEDYYENIDIIKVEKLIEGLK